MRETTATSEGELLPPGRYVFTVAKPVEKKKTDNGHIYYVWKLRALIDGKQKPFTYLSMVFQAAGILRGLKQEETKKGVFEWDRDEVEGMQFVADLFHEPDFKDKSKTRANLKNFQPIDGATSLGQSESTPSDEGPIDDEEPPY